MSARASHPQRQALGVLAAALGLPSVKGLRGRGAPRVESTTLGGQPATIIRPAGPPPWPALLFANGATPDGRAHPVIVRLGVALARSGHAVCIPDLPGITVGELTPATLRAALACTAELADDPGTRNGRVGLVGVSLGASLALLVGAEQRVAPRVTVVVCIAPFADLEKVMLLATTGMYRGQGGLEPYPVPATLSLGLGRSLAALVPAGSPASKEAVEALLENGDPARFDPLFAALPESIRETIASLSPINSVSRLLAPVEIATAPRDRYFPVAESLALAELNPNVTVTVSSALGHAIPRLELGNLAGLRPLNRFFTRSLEAAGSS